MMLLHHHSIALLVLLNQALILVRQMRFPCIKKIHQQFFSRNCDYFHTVFFMAIFQI
jgi:hypothetical protein